MKFGHLFFYVLIIFFTQNLSAHIGDSTQCLIFKNVESNRIKKFKNHSKITVWVNKDEFTEISGTLNIINDTLILIEGKEITINNIVAFKKSKIVGRSIGNMMMVSGLASSSIGGLGLLLLRNANIVDFTSFFYVALGYIVAIGSIGVGAIYTAIGLGVRLSATSKKNAIIEYEPSIEWVYSRF